MKAVILAGGSGTRLWPLSRKSCPKQFQKLISDRTMFQETIARIDFLKPEDIYVSTNQQYLDLVREQSRGLIPEGNIIVEPALRETAPCIGLAAAIIGKKFPEEVMAIIYADHHIQNKEEFIEKLKIAEKVSSADRTISIIEVKAKYPNVNLGYVKIGNELKVVDGTEIFEFEKFTEKPDLETAKEFLKSYKYLWNTGLFVWRIDKILALFKSHLPNTYSHLMTIQNAIGTDQEEQILNTHYPLCDKISIDYGIMEKVDPSEVNIIPADLGWSDVGTWESIYDELSPDQTGNLIKANLLQIDTSRSLVYGRGKKLIALIGVDNLVIVDTEDALLICNKKRSHEVKKIVEMLKNIPDSEKLL